MVDNSPRPGGDARPVGDARRFSPDPASAREFEPVLPAEPSREERAGAADEYSRRFYNEQYLATGSGASAGSTDRTPAATRQGSADLDGTHEPFRAAHRDGSTRGSATTAVDEPVTATDEHVVVSPGLSAAGHPNERPKHPKRNPLWILVGIVGAILAVLLVTTLLFFTLPNATTSADPTLSPKPTATAGAPDSGAVAEGMDPVVVGSTFTVPQDRDNSDNTIELEFTSLDPAVEDHEGIISDLGLWSGDQHTYAVLVADVTNTGPDTELTDEMLPVFVRTAEGQTPYRFESAVVLDAPWSIVRLPQGEPVELAFIFPVPDGETVVEVGIAPVGHWWDKAVWTPAPETKEI